MIFAISPSLAAGAGVGEESHLARDLDGASDLTLLLDGDTGHAARADLAAVRDELAQERGVLVVDPVDLGGLERVDLLTRLARVDLCHGGSLQIKKKVRQSCRLERRLVRCRGRGPRIGVRAPCRG